MPKAQKVRQGEQRLVGVIGDEDTITGFLLAGVGDQSNRRGGHGPNFQVVTKTTPLCDIEQAFHDMVSRPDIAVVLICQHIANDIRFAIEQHTDSLPCVLEIPSKEIPYDSSKDPVLTKLNRFLGGGF